jgi:hypothetical protein
MHKEEEIFKIPDIQSKALHYVFEKGLVKDDGLWLEFGVHAGGTINRIGKYTSKNIIFGFDSFEGLPEDWTGRIEPNNVTYPKGTFSLGGNMPQVPAHISLIKGWYKDTLPNFIKNNNSPISFIHIDSDIYSSAKDIFTYTKHKIKNNCIIVFDELVGYKNFEEHEWKAWWEFVEQFNIDFEWIGGNRSGLIINELPQELKFDSDRKEGENVSPSIENVAVRIINNPLFTG